MHIQNGTEASWELWFVDARLPHEILALLERDLMKAFAMSIQEGKLAYRAAPKVNGVPYEFDLCFDSVSPAGNGYRLRIRTSWGHFAADKHEYFKKSSESWVKFWTRDFKMVPPPGQGAAPGKEYQELRDESLHAEDFLNSVESIQRRILSAVKSGADFSTAHKEGGSIWKWFEGGFIRSDYGEETGLTKFGTEEEFLKALREFYDWETSRAVYPEKSPELEVWRLIFRKMNRNQR